MHTGRERGQLLVRQIYEEYEARAKDRRPNRLRPSELGHECTRHLWIRYRWADKFERFEGRMLRLFESGHHQEPRMVSDLRSVGATVYAVDPDNPKEQISCGILDGHSKGYLDGVAQFVPHSNEEWVLTEFKTHSEKSFKSLEKDGVERAKPQHYAQMQLYMQEHSLKEALYFSVNKNTDHLYAEFVPYNERYADTIVRKANGVVFHPAIPARINNSGTYFTCKMCSSKETCFYEQRPPRTCRTCMFGHPATMSELIAAGNEKAIQAKRDGRKIDVPFWHCTKHSSLLDLQDQKDGCGKHRYNPQLISANGGTETFIHDEPCYEYVGEDGEIYTDMGPKGDRAKEAAE